jgi:hypothetical protein
MIIGRNHYGGMIILALLGATVATFCDGVHVYTQTLSYTHPFWFGQPWWVYPNFTLAFIFMAFAYLLIIKRVPAGMAVQKSVSPGSARALTESVVMFALIYLLSGFGNFEPVFLSVIFYGTFALRWFCSYDRTWLLLIVVVMAIGGMLAEGVVAAVGLMQYRHADVFYVPFWLGGLYLHGAFALREGLRFFVYPEK